MTKCKHCNRGDLNVLCGEIVQMLYNAVDIASKNKKDTIVYRYGPEVCENVRKHVLDLMQDRCPRLYFSETIKDHCRALRIDLNEEARNGIPELEQVPIPTDTRSTAQEAFVKACQRFMMPVLESPFAAEA